MVSILVLGLRKGPLSSTLARELPEDLEGVMEMVQKYINEEEMKLLKD